MTADEVCRHLAVAHHVVLQGLAYDELVKVHDHEHLAGQGHDHDDEEPPIEAYTHQVGPTPGCGGCHQLQTDLDLCRTAVRRQQDRRWQAENDLERIRMAIEKLADTVKWERYSTRTRAGRQEGDG